MLSRPRQRAFLLALFKPRASRRRRLRRKGRPSGGIAQWGARQDAEQAPRGHGRPVGAYPRSNAGRRVPRLKAGPNRSQWFPPFAETKGAAVKAEPVEPAHTDNGYTHRRAFLLPRKICFNSWSCILFDERQLAGEKTLKTDRYSASLRGSRQQAASHKVIHAIRKGVREPATPAAPAGPENVRGRSHKPSAASA